MGNGDAGDSGGMDDDMEVAVVLFDDSDEDGGGRDDDDDDDDDTDRSDVGDDVVVVDIDDALSTDEEGGATSAAVREGANECDDDDEGRLVSSSSSSTARILPVHEIDAHFLHRKLSSPVKKDAVECADLADWVLEALDVRGAGSCGMSILRETENRLLVLLGFERFDLLICLSSLPIAYVSGDAFH